MVASHEFEARMRGMEDSLSPAGQFLHLLSDYLDAPRLYQSAGMHFGYRYANPDARHFCLLKGARMVSGAYACVHLARGGFTQELAVIIRTIVECASHIDWVLLAASPSGSLVAGPQNKFVSRYFEDFRRDEPSDAPKPRVPQEEVHRSVGNWLDARVSEERGDLDRGPAKSLMSDVYLNYSNFVHARYPEVMDMYGGRPGVFHLRGMRGTPKDYESCATIPTFITTVVLTIARVAQHFDLRFMDDEPELRTSLGL